MPIGVDDLEYSVCVARLKDQAVAIIREAFVVQTPGAEAEVAGVDKGANDIAASDGIINRESSKDGAVDLCETEVVIICLGIRHLEMPVYVFVAQEASAAG